MKGVVLAIALAVGMLSTVAASGSAAQDQCSDASAWPSFAQVVPTARSIMLVRVTRSVDGIAQKARLVEVMKGSSRPTIDLRRLQPGRIDDRCPAPSGPYAQVGDRLLIAYDGTAPDRVGSIDAVAHVGRLRDRSNTSGHDRLTLEEARAYDASEPDLPEPPRDAPSPRTRSLTDVIGGAIPKPVRTLALDVRDAVLVAITATLLTARSSLSPSTDGVGDGATDSLWSCGGDPPGFPRSVLTGPTGVEKMEGAVFDGLRRALETMRSEFEFEPREDRPHQLPWTLAYHDDDLALFLVRRAGKTERYSVMYVEREGDEWGFGGYSDDCRPRPLITHGLGSSTWRVTRGARPASGSSSFPIEVMERECASGRPADGRIADPIVEYGEDAITITVPVRHVEGDATCPGNPWTPFVLELDQPIGDRRLLDGGPWPPEQRWPWP